MNSQRAHDRNNAGRAAARTGWARYGQDRNFRRVRGGAALQGRRPRTRPYAPRAPGSAVTDRRRTKPSPDPNGAVFWVPPPVVLMFRAMADQIKSQARRCLGATTMGAGDHHGGDFPYCPKAERAGPAWATLKEAPRRAIARRGEHTRPYDPATFKDRLDRNLSGCESGREPWMMAVSHPPSGRVLAPCREIEEFAILSACLQRGFRRIEHLTRLDRGCFAGQFLVN